MIFEIRTYTTLPKVCCKFYELFFYLLKIHGSDSHICLPFLRDFENNVMYYIENLLLLDTIRKTADEHLNILVYFL